MKRWITHPTATRMVNGLQWPAHYGNVDDEYQACVKGAALLDLGAYEFLGLKGSDVVGFLQGLTTQDVHGLKPGASADSWFLDANGRIVTFTRLFKAHPQEILIQTPPGEAQALLTHLDRFLIMEDVVMTVRDDLAGLSLQGPQSKDLAGGAQVLSMDHDRSGCGGVDLVVSRDDAGSLVESLCAAGAVLVGQDAFDMARIEAFIPQYGIDMTVGQNPVVYGLGQRISNTKGCYIGQETVAMTRDRGRPPQLLVWLKSDAADAPEPGSALLLNGQPVGVLSSLSLSTRYSKFMGLALVKYKVAEELASLTDEKGNLWTIEKVSNYKANEP